ncbi:IdeS/Mac family cysteine endopeptidase [Mycoplasma sp. ES3225-GEN-MYC]|uniref:Ig protease IdeS domain-containing protein n=1 Tax=Mycoplasma miroungigenitalium TaxID=754515 RepID=A0A6M4JBS7_9MOLU|nr:IdeS/Mac family cysteine endopeptidase [Mycoplasma miroungigenitalium]MBU4691709.1 IdeS/Mac family cysteine endopeptidase [Mycoplasma miroungigenitalium]QJR43537.1 hypothetical protein HLA87_01905 [Mycoplasma miroungigenitalium]
MKIKTIPLILTLSSFPTTVSCATIKNNDEANMNIKISNNTKQETKNILIEADLKKRNNNNFIKDKTQENTDSAPITNKNTDTIENNSKAENNAESTDEKNIESVADIKNNDVNENNKLNKNDNLTINKGDITKIIPSLRNNVAETLWVNGVNVNVENFRKQNDPSLVVYEYPLRNSKNEGWYDINKRLVNGDWSLCSAVVAANWLHWWLDRNREYVNRYIKDFPDKAMIKAGDITKKLENIMINFPDENNYYDRSRIFDYFTELFPNKALFPNKLIDMFINGYKYTSNNYELNNENNYKPVVSRGFFKDVFKHHTLTSYVSPGSREMLSINIRNWIKEGRALAVSFGSGNKGHIVTIWGADFDKDGNILAVYISDSDNKDDKMKMSKESEYERVGMTRLRIDYSAGNARLSGYVEDGKGVNIWHIYSIQDGCNYWKDFFEKIVS